VRPATSGVNVSHGAGSVKAQIVSALVARAGGHRRGGRRLLRLGPDAQVRLGHLGRQRDQLEDLAEDGVGAR